MRRLGGERRDMSGWHQAPPKKGLLILAVEDEDSDQSILDHLEQQFHFRVTHLFGRVYLLPALSPHAQQIKTLIQPQKQGFSALVELEGLIVRLGGQGLTITGGERENFFTQSELAAQMTCQFRGEGRKCFGIHGTAVGTPERFAVVGALVEAARWNWRLAASALFCHRMKLMRQRAMSKTVLSPGGAFVPRSDS